MIDSGINAQSLDHLILATLFAMFIFTFGCLANYLFNLALKSCQSQFFFCKFSLASPKLTPGGAVDQSLDRRDGSGEPAAAAGTSPVTEVANHNKAEIVAGECTGSECGGEWKWNDIADLCERGRLLLTRPHRFNNFY